MFKKFLLSAALLCAFCVGACAESGINGFGIDGNWKGSMRQYDWDQKSDYPVHLSVDGDHGTSDYPTLKCGGNLARIARSGDYSIFTETITRGRFNPGNQEGCLDGILTVIRVNQPRRVQQLFLGWYGVRDGVESTATARLEPVLSK